MADGQAHDSYHQSAEGITVLGNFEQRITRLTTSGATLGFGVWSWSDWVARAGEAGMGPAAHATQLCVGPKSIERAGEADLVQVVDGWLSHPNPTLKLLPIVGKHGSGLTWTLFRIGHRLAQLGHAEQLFVADDPEALSSTDLKAVLPTGQPLVLLLDDADIQQAVRPIRALGTAMSLCVAYTSADKRYAMTLSALSGSRQEHVLELPAAPSPQEREQLRQTFGKSHLSHSERREAARGNTRSVARVLRNGSTTFELTRRLVDLMSQDGRPDLRTPPPFS